jgi:hypothetical protein
MAAILTVAFAILLGLAACSPTKVVTAPVQAAVQAVPAERAGAAARTAA